MRQIVLAVLPSDVDICQGSRGLLMVSINGFLAGATRKVMFHDRFNSDEVFGEKAVRRLKLYQLSCMVPTTGIIDQATRDEMKRDGFDVAVVAELTGVESFLIQQTGEMISWLVGPPVDPRQGGLPLEEEPTASMLR